MVRARAGDPGARRRRARERVHAHRAGAVRPAAVARRAVHPGRDHAAAEVVLLPSRQGVLLVAHRDGAAVHPVHAQAARRRIRATCTSASCSRRRRSCERDYFRDAARAAGSAGCSCVLDRLGRRIDPLIPAARCARARPGAAEQWMLERLNGEDGLGAIFPGDGQRPGSDGDPRLRGGRPAARHGQARACRSCWSIGPTSAYCQPCVSPVWDTALAALAMQEAGCPHVARARRRARSTGCRPSSCWMSRATGRSTARNLRGGGWAFQFANELLPGSRRHRGGRLGHAPGAERRGLCRERAPRARLAGGHAERERRIRGVRRRQHLAITSTRFLSPITARCSIRRPAM